MAVAVEKDEATADPAYRRIPKRFDQPSQRIGTEVGVGVGEDQHLRGGRPGGGTGDKILQHDGLAAVLFENAGVDCRTGFGRPAHDRGGLIVATIDPDQHGDTFERIVQGQQVVEARPDRVLLVVRGEDDGDRRLRGSTGVSARAGAPRHDGEKQRIADPRIEEDPTSAANSAPSGVNRRPPLRRIRRRTGRLA